jgi:hypothetical protein
VPVRRSRPVPAGLERRQEGGGGILYDAYLKVVVVGEGGVRHVEEDQTSRKFIYHLHLSSYDVVMRLSFVDLMVGEGGGSHLRAKLKTMTGSSDLFFTMPRILVMSAATSP